jgi:FkbM family methyltransferase
MLFSKVIKIFARQFGIELRRYDPAQSEVARLVAVMLHHGVDLVLDVGANEGTYAKMLRDGGYTGGLISFEPLEAAHRALNVAAAGDAAWVVAPRVAVGHVDGEIEINVAGNSTSSSILAMKEAHRQAAPASSYVARERVKLIKLDSYVHPMLQDVRAPFLKIDTQGYEASVLDGAESTLNRVAGVQIELSLIALYEGQALYLELIQRLLQKGFVLWGISPGFVDKRTGRLLQFDGIFFRE